MAPVVLDDRPPRTRSADRRPAQLGQDALGLLGVRRIQEDPGEAARVPRGQPPQRAADVGADHGRARSSRPSSRRLRRRATRAAVIALDEHRRGTRPRDSASMPERARCPRRGPAPARGGGPRMLKIASRTLAAVGRVCAPRGRDEPPASIEPAGQPHVRVRSYRDGSDRVKCGPHVGAPALSATAPTRRAERASALGAWTAPVTSGNDAGIVNPGGG